MASESLIKKIQTLPPDKAAEVEDFVDFLRMRHEDGRWSDSAAKLSEEAFERVWDNAEDAVYDEL